MTIYFIPRILSVPLNLDQQITHSSQSLSRYFLNTSCWFGWFLCLMAYQLFLGYLMPKPFSWKKNKGTI